MSTNRIQKLLFSEYCDFEDMVLVESPFAQTTRDGRGIRQVNLGLTPTKLVIATDILPPAKESTVSYLPGVDPEIETFELVAVYPVECLNLSIFHRRRRQSLKAHFCNNRILYFEMGGFEKRQMFWNLWCERVKFLSPEDPGSSHSETSVATSSSNSTLYLLAAKRVFTDSGIPQIWCKFGVGNLSNTNIPKWTDRYLYLGKNLDESPMNYTPIMKPLSASQFIRPNKRALTKNIFSMPTLHNNPLQKPSKFQMIKRFGGGVPEGCASGLFLSITESSNSFIKHRSFSGNQSGDDTVALDSESDEKRSFYEAVENAVRLWELSRDINPSVINRGRHRRRYGFSPQPHFLNALGPWSVSPGERFSVQAKRALSCVRIQRQPAEPELRLPVSKKQLTTSISYDNLNLHDDKLAIDTFKTALRKPVVFFWTPDYWYRPRSARDAYHEMLGHLNKLREYCQTKTKETKKGKKRFFKPKKKNPVDSEDEGDQKKRKSIISAIFNVPRDVTSGIEMKHHQETSLEYLRRILRVEIALTAWDFDSTTLACQLTLIDRDLFLKIPSLELATLLSQRSSKNAPNIGALQAFSHRISCLVATEILNSDSEKIRARLIARVINTAEKCHKLGNFQSCKSILCGLQSPAVYRLRATWTYLRKRHATKYQLFESLCRLYRDPRLPGYQKAFHRTSLKRPFLPYIGDLLARLLGKVPPYSALALAQVPSHRHVSTSTRITSQRTSQSRSSNTSSLRKLLSTLRIFPDSSEQMVVGVTESTQTSETDSSSRANKLTKAIEYLENGQRAAAAYTMQENDIAREFLLKARYREDRENFINSLVVEKPRLDDSEYAYNY